MAYGLRIINDDSELLIDSDYINPTFLQKLEFDTTPTLVEAATGYIHPGYIKREYKSTSAVTAGAAGNAYIVMWTLPDNGSNDIYYNFDTSIALLNEKLTCYVYANSTGTALTYTLPTAYVFAVTAEGISSIPSAGPALRMYNSDSPQKKTFDSNLVQLAPYSITDTFAFSVSGANVNNYGTTPVSISLSIPTNPIFMLPDFHALRINKGPINSLAHQEYLYETAFRRVGTTLYTRLFVVDYTNEDYAWPITQTTFTSGNNNQLSVIVADANLYESVSAGGGGGGSNPTYTLSSNFSSRDEGTTVVVTLNTTLVADNTEFFYTVTGIAAADLSAGSITGKFIVVNNTATASFTFANDLLTEGTETFTLSLDGMTQSISVTVNDTSKQGIFSWSTPGNVNEGATGYTTFNATNANGKTVTFGIVAPLSGTSISGPSDGTLITTSWTVSGDAATSINVQYSAVADLSTEGPEGFRLIATVDGVTYTSNDIIVNDTSKTAGYSLSAADNWNESGTYAVTIGANNVNGTTLYLTTDNSLVTPSSSTVTVNSDTFTTNINYTGGIVTANTAVRLHLRTGSAAGTIQAFKDIILTNVTPSYSFGTASAFNEGSSGSIQFNYSYAANTAVTFELTAPSSGTSGVSDTTLNTTTFSIGATNDAGNVSVTYSAGADSITEGAEYFRIVAKVGTTVVATSSNITINDTSQYPAYGTAIGSASCVPGTYTLRQVRADGSGGTYNDDTTNSPTCGYVAASYSFTSSVTSVNEGGSFTITLNTNQSGSFPYTITGVSSADIGGASLSGSLSNGGVLTVNVSADATTEGTETFTITLNNGLATKSVTINDTSLYPAYGTYITQYCSGYNLYYTYANGSGGTYNELQETNSASCGYVAPAYSLGNTFSSLANGSSGTFYLYATNANGVSVTVSKSGTGSSRVSLDTTSFTISGSSSYTYITVTATMPTTTVASQSVTISLSTGNSFSFTLPAFTAQAPLVSSVADIMYSPTYYNGETITYAINMNGAITSDTYVRVAIWVNVLANGSGGQEAGYNIFTGGQSISGVVGSFPIGTYTGYYTTNPNAGYNFKVMVKAKAVTAGGADRQSYVNGTVRQLSSSPPP